MPGATGVIISPFAACRQPGAFSPPELGRSAQPRVPNAAVPSVTPPSCRAREALPRGGGPGLGRARVQAPGKFETGREGGGGREILCVFVLLCSGINLTGGAGRQHDFDLRKQGKGGLF